MCIHNEMEHESDNANRESIILSIRVLFHKISE